MKVVAYNIRAFEKESLAKANQKKHEITLISDPLTLDNVGYADGKEAAIIDAGDDLSAQVIAQLAQKGIKFIATRSKSTQNIDLIAASLYRIKLANISEAESVQEIALQTITNLDNWQQNKCVGNACICAKNCRQPSN